MKLLDYSSLYLISSFKLFNRQASKMAANRGKRLTDVQGFENRKNSIYFYPALKNKQQNCSNLNNKNCVIFFGGDGQDFVEIMEKHRENQRHAEWNIERTSEIISRKFPFHNILFIKPVKMLLGIFNSYANFVPSKDYGIPEFQADNKAWLHLRLLIENSYKEIFQSLPKDKFLLDDAEIVLIGFSKGCVVLNQLVWELPLAVNQPKGDDTGNRPKDTELINRVTDFYWLDGGHGGGKDTWVTNVNLLKSLAALPCKIHAHVTPYQVHDSRRPYLGKEYKKFCDILSKITSANFQRKIHFENEEPSLDNHFKLLTVFEDNKV